VPYPRRRRSGPANVIVDDHSRLLGTIVPRGEHLPGQEVLRGDAPRLARGVGGSGRAVHNHTLPAPARCSAPALIQPASQPRRQGRKTEPLHPGAVHRRGRARRHRGPDRINDRFEVGRAGRQPAHPRRDQPEPDHAVEAGGPPRPRPRPAPEAFLWVAVGGSPRPPRSLENQYAVDPAPRAGGRAAA
jgi:hypothetical protein